MCGQLQLLTSNHSSRNRVMLLFGGVKALGAPGSSHRQPETTQEVVALSTAPDLSESGRVDIPTRPVAAA